MAFTGKGKPPKKGKVTEVFEQVGKTIGIDGKTIMVIDERVDMALKMELKIGEAVSYRQLSQGPDKNKINFLARSVDDPEAGKQEQPPVNTHNPAPVTTEQEAPKKELLVIIGIYKDRKSTNVTITRDGKDEEYPADLSVIKTLSNPDKVKKGDNLRWGLQEVNGSFAILRVGPAEPGTEMKTAKDLLQENLNSMKKTAPANQPLPAGNDDLPAPCKACKIVHDCPLLDPHAGCETEVLAAFQKAKEEEEGRKRMEENAKAAEQLAKEKSAAKTSTESTGGVSQSQPPAKQEIGQPVQGAGTNPPAPAGSGPAQRQVEFIGQEIPADVPPAAYEATGGVELAVHINLGNYSSMDLKVVGANGNHARQLLKQESKPTVELVKTIIKDATKGF